MSLRSKISLKSVLMVLVFLQGCGSSKKSDAKETSSEAVDPEVAKKAKEDEAIAEILGVYEGIPEQDPGGDWGGAGGIIIKKPTITINRPGSDTVIHHRYSLNGLKVVLDDDEELNFSEDKKTITASFGVFVKRIE